MEIPLTVWSPQAGDHLLIDTEHAKGTLVRGDGLLYTTFPVILGQQRVVTYIGRTYKAETPDWHWIAKSRHIKGDHITFGPTGRFLRLYKDGTEYTHYGIHEHRSEERMFGEENRYQSMGCIIVQRAVLDIIEKTYELNGEMLNVVTQKGASMDGVARETGENA
jgi:hypothetical protein